MTGRRPCPAAPGPLEGYAARFDDLFASLAQRRGFREYLAGLLAPRERNKTLTALAGAEPVTGSKLPAVQRLQFFLSESVWDPDRVNDRRLELLRADPATAPHDAGVLVIDDSGDRKDGTKTAHVGRQWPGRYGKTGSGVVTVTTVWAGERLYYPVHAVPYTPARHFAKGRNDPAFRTRLQIGADLAVRARAAGFAFRAVVADFAYGDQDGFRGGLSEAGLPFVMALKPRRGTWARGPDAHTPVEAARELAWGGPDDPGDWHPVTRTFRDGHAGTWHAADATLGGWGPDGFTRLVVATAGPGNPAGQGRLVPGHQPAAARRPPRGRQPSPGGRPGRDRPDLRPAELDRAQLQAGQGRAGLGRFPGPLRCRDPPPPGAGLLRIQLLLGDPVRVSGTARRHAAGTRSRRRGEGGPDPPGCPSPRRAGPGRSAPCAPGSPRGSRCGAGGPHGRMRSRPLNSSTCLTPSARATACTSTSRLDSTDYR
jgi:hypothetical protein